MISVGAGGLHRRVLDALRDQTLIIETGKTAVQENCFLSNFTLLKSERLSTACSRVLRARSYKMMAEYFQFLFASLGAESPQPVTGLDLFIVLCFFTVSKTDVSALI